MVKKSESGRVITEYKEVTAPIKRIVGEDLELDRDLIAQPSKSKPGYVTFYVRGRSDSRVRLSPINTLTFAEELIKLADQVQEGDKQWHG